MALSPAELCRETLTSSAEFCRKKADFGRILPKWWLKAFYIKAFEALQTIYIHTVLKDLLKQTTVCLVKKRI